MSQFDIKSCIETWKLIELSDIIDGFDQALYLYTSNQGIVRTDDYKNILLDIAGKSIVTSREIICLVSNGYADGAMALARTLYEHYIIISFFECRKRDSDFNDIIEDYYLDYYRSRNRYIECYAKAINDSKLLEKVKNDNEELKKVAHKKIRGDYWWCGKSNFSELVSYIVEKTKKDGLENIQNRAKLFYKQACLFIHSNCFGNKWRLKYDSANSVTETGPSIEGNAIPLEFTTSSLILIICAICAGFEIDYTDFRTKLNDLALFYLEINNENAEKMRRITHA